jgi:signal transduction histidine kinase
MAAPSGNRATIVARPVSCGRIPFISGRCVCFFSADSLLVTKDATSAWRPLRDAVELTIVKTFFRPARRLQWKLTVSYAVITMVTLFLVTFVGALAATENVTANSAHLGAGVLRAHAGDLVPYMSAAPPDQAAISHWLEQNELLTTTMEVSSFPHATYSVTLDGWTAVVDRQGIVVAAHGAGSATPGALLEQLLSPQTRTPLQAALSGQTDDRDLATTLADGTTTVAYPLLGPQHAVEGALIVQTAGVSEPVLLLRAVATALALSIPAAILVACIAGVFGYFTARGFSGRLKRLSFAVEHWGQGDFTLLAQDKSADELGQMTRRLNRLAAQFQALLRGRQQIASLAERNRLARDLHDSVKQQAFAISMLLTSARSALKSDLNRAETYLDEVDGVVRDLQQELTTLVRALRPTALTEKGLAAAVEDLVSHWSEQTGIATRLAVEGNDDLPPTVEEALFRIVQEALTNIARHSHATTVTVALTTEPNAIKLTIDDNGAGFDPDTAVGTGVGLLSLRERALSVGGTLLVDSAVGQGTHITVSAPTQAGDQARDAE